MSSVQFTPVETGDMSEIPPDAPAGEWEAVCKVRQGKTSKDSFPMLILEWKLTDAITDGNEDHVGAKVTDFVVFFPSTHAASKMSKIRLKKIILGYSADEVIGKHVSALMPPEHAEDVIRLLGHIGRGERVGHFETQRRTKHGRIIDVSLSVSPIRDADGQIVGAAKVARDITERKRAEAERERLLAAAEAATEQSPTA